MIKLLAIPGSLRTHSSSNAILQAIAAMAPANVDFEIYNGIGMLPHFNDADDVPDTVISFRKKIQEADVVLICTPEYAFGIPGSLKNAIDWTVSSGEFLNKPVGLITASSVGERGHTAMLLVLTAISAKVIDEATFLISFVRSKLDRDGSVSDPAVTEKLRVALTCLLQNAQPVSVHKNS